MAINFANITLELFDASSNSTPDFFVNLNGISFSKKVLEDMNYPQYVQFLISAEHNIFAVRVCKGNDAKAVPFSKPKAEQQANLAMSNKTLHDVLKKMIPNSDERKRYKITGEYDSNTKTMFFEMKTAVSVPYRGSKELVE